MATSPKILARDDNAQDGDWIVVVPRRGKHRRTVPKATTPIEEEQQPWVPIDTKCDLQRRAKLMQKIEFCMNKVEKSQFCRTILEQIQNPETLECFRRVLGSERKMQMVMYGIGSIESCEIPRLQLSLAILIKRKFNWIGGIEVFDPILSATETSVLKAHGCSVLSINEQGKRQATKPTLFYMPHCEAQLYNNLLRANWDAQSLNGVVLFGNSFKVYYRYASEFKSSTIIDSLDHILAAKKFTNEIDIKTVSDDYFPAFHDSSWHFFSPDLKTELKIIKT